MSFQRDRLRVAAAVVGVALVCAACSGGTVGGGPDQGGADAAYQVRIVTSATGAGNAIGSATLDAFQTVIGQANDDGGVNGRKIEVKVLDDQSDTAVAANVARSAVGDAPIAILDGSSSAPLAARVPVYKSAGTTVMAVSEAGLPLQPWFFTAALTTSQGASSNINGAESLLGSLEGKKVALISTASPGGQAISAAEKALVEERGGTVTNQEFQEIGAPSFTSQASNILSNSPDVVVIVDAGSSAIIESKALISAGYEGPIVTNYAASDDLTLKSINSPQVHGVRIVASAKEDTGMYKSAKNEGRVEGTENAFFGLGWVAAETLVTGLEACGDDCDSSALQEALESLEEFEVSGDALPFGEAVLNSSTHNIITSGQLFVWDSASSESKAIGSPIEVGEPNYPNR